jgi:peptidoglycan hydrolase-like protein with peptidoglycan-binding domain
VFRNFDVIYGYNAAESYALAIAHLADRIQGGNPSSPPGRPTTPASRAASDAKCRPCSPPAATPIGEIDGMIGANSRQAIHAEQKRLAMPADGRAGQKLLRALRSSAAAGQETAPDPGGASR